MTRVGTLREIWRFPVKSMQGGAVPSAQVTPRGLVGDRAWAMCDEIRQEVQWGKRFPQLMRELAAAFAREPGEPLPDMAQFPPVLMDHVAVPGTFFDNEELHLLTSASLAWLAGRSPSARWDVRRFRPNFYIETVPALDGLVEQAWVGKRLRIDAIEITISAPTPRCGMTVQPQGELPYDKSILCTLVKDAGQNLGVGAHCLVAGRVRAGDAVELLDGEA